MILDAAVAVARLRLRAGDDATVVAIGSAFNMDAGPDAQAITKTWLSTVLGTAIVALAERT